MLNAEETKSLKKEVLEVAKSRGLDLAEEAVADLANLALDLVSLVVKKTGNKTDDLVWGALELPAREIVADLVDKIDGEEG